MHNYAIDSDKRIKWTCYIALISVSILFIIGIVLNEFNIKFIPLDINLKTIMFLIFKIFTVGIFIFTSIFYLFDKILWKWKFIKKFHNIPDLNGVWTGEFMSDKKDENGNNYVGDCKVKINQTWSKIKITSTFNQSISDSELGYIKVNGTEGVVLTFNYQNNVNNPKGTEMKNHKGTNNLRYIEEEEKLVGDYFTNASRRTTGYMHVQRINREEAISV